MKTRTHRFEFCAQLRQNSMKTIGTDVRAGIECNLGIGPRSDQRLKDGRLECVLCSGIELAIGVGPCPALSEEQVTLGIEFP